MPYITRERRAAMGGAAAASATPRTAGELNYILTAQVIAYVEREGLDYQTINDVIGALTGAHAEFYRRIAAPYEDAKIHENGDVYPADLLARARSYRM